MTNYPYWFDTNQKAYVKTNLQTGENILYFVNDDGYAPDGDEVFNEYDIEYVTIKQIDCGKNHTLYLLTNGDVYACGANTSYQTGITTTTSDITEITKVTGLSNVKYLSAGENYSMFVLDDGTVYTIGYNGYGQLGLGNTTSMTTLTNISSLSNIKYVYCGKSSNKGTTFFIDNDNTIYACGDNTYGRLGVGDTTQRTSPTEITTNIGIVTKIVSGYRHTIFLTTDNLTYACGDNTYGQLCKNNSSLYYVPTIGVKTNVIDIAAGYNSSMLLLSDGTVYGCGYNNKGELGLGNTSSTTTLVLISSLTDIAKIDMVSYETSNTHSFVLKNNGNIYTAGYIYCFNYTTSDTFKLIGTDVKEIHLNGSQTYHIIKNDNTIWAAGSNSNGQLGIQDYVYITASTFEEVDLSVFNMTTYTKTINDIDCILDNNTDETIYFYKQYVEEEPTITNIELLNDKLLKVTINSISVLTDYQIEVDISNLSLVDISDYLTVLDTISDDTSPTILDVYYDENIAYNIEQLITITCSDDNKILKAELYINGLYIDDMSTEDDLTFTYNYTFLETGEYSIQFKVYDVFNNYTTSKLYNIYAFNFGEYYIDQELNLFMPVNIPAESTINKYLKFEGDYSSNPLFFSMLVNSIFNNWTKSVNFNFEYEADGITIKEGTISKITTIDSKVIDLSFFLNQYTSTEDINLINLSDLVKCRINMGSLVTYVDSVEVNSTELDYTGELVESEEQSDWAYENIISINPTAETLTDYQLAIELSSFENMKHMNTDLSDIRFTSYDGLTNISYWIESYDYETQDAKIWIKVPLTSTTENTKIKMKYGNSNATSESNIDNVMLFGDDFSGTDLDTNKWTLQGTGNVIISNEHVDVYGTDECAIYSNSSYSYDTILEIMWKGTFVTSSDAVYPGFGYGDGLYDSPIEDTYLSNGVAIGRILGNTDYVIGRARNTDVQTTTLSGATDWDSVYKKYKIIRDNTESIIYVTDGVEYSQSTQVPTDDLKIGIGLSYSSGGTPHSMADYIFVRQYTETEPTYEIMSENMEEWNYSTTITIASTESVPNDYQLKIELSNNDIYFDKLNENGNDIRFTLDDKKTQLSYWIESLDITNKESTIWIKIPEISDTVDTTLYMYYGNDNAIAKSDGEEVFEFFDDFETFDTNKWSLVNGTVGTATYSIEDSAISFYASSDGNCNLVSLDTFDSDISLVTKQKIIDVNSDSDYRGRQGFNAMSSPVYASDSYPMTYYYIGDSGYSIACTDGSTSYAENMSISPSTISDYHVYKLDRYDTGAKISQDGNLLHSITSSLNDGTSERIETRLWEGQKRIIDYIFVMKYSVNEPTYTTSNVENLNEWTYYTPITITPTESTTNYQIKIELTTDNFDFTKVNNDGSDIRITQSNKTTQLPYWIESFDKTNETAIIWTKVPTLVNGVNTTLYLFSGNINASSSIDDGNNVFELFDDFSGTELDIDKWTFNRIFYTGTYTATIVDGILEIATGSDTSGALISKESFNFPFTYTIRHKGATSTSAYFNSIVQSSSGTNSNRVGYAHLGNNTWKTSKRTDDAEIIYDSGDSKPTHTYFLNETGKFTNSSMTFYENDIQINDITTQDRFSSGDNYLQFAVYESTMYYDFIFVRKYISSEPLIEVGDIQVNSQTTSVYNYKLPITIGTSDNIYTDYILPIKLTSSNFDFTKISENFNDLKIMNSDSTIEIPYYLAKADRYNETALIYVKLPSISNVSTTIINLYYNENVTGLHPRSNWESVFGEDCLFYLPYSLTLDETDISPNQITMNNNGVTFDSTDGATFDGTSYISMANDLLDGVSKLTVAYKYKSTAESQYMIFGCDGDDRIEIFHNSGSVLGRTRMYTKIGGTAIIKKYYADSSLYDGNEHSEIVYFDNSSTTGSDIYLDGDEVILVDDGTQSTGTLGTMSYNLGIGAYQGASIVNYMTGTIKELFIYTRELTSNEITNINSITPTYVFGDEEYIGELNTIIYSNKKYNLKIDLNDGLKLILNGTVIYENNDPLDTMNTITLCDVNESNIKLNRISIYDTITDTTCTFYEKNY